MSVRRPAAAPLQAYVLHQYDWSETSLVVELLTRSQGRVVVVAKGAKRPYSQLRPVLLPFQRLLVTLGRAPADESAEIFNLRAAEWAGGPPAQGGGALFSGFYLNELLLKLLPRQDPHPVLFDAYAQALVHLDPGDDAASQAALRAFELTLLRELGWLPELSCVTATLEPLKPAGAYVLHGELGVVAGGEAALTGRTLLALEQALTTGDEAALRAAAGGERSALRAQLRGLLHYHLPAGPLRTREVLRGVQRLLETEVPQR